MKYGVGQFKANQNMAWSQAWMTIRKVMPPIKTRMSKP